jgi:hypothetical protein
LRAHLLQVLQVRKLLLLLRLLMQVLLRGQF